jgi:hypothetical protein
MINRWHVVSIRGAIILCESDDAQALAGWSASWADPIVLEIIPAVDDDQVAGVLGR